jgi:hypothetical protein
MIRRDQPLPDGTPGWVLITQPAHAALAGDLAAAWGSPAVPPPWPHEMVIDAVDCHDDGWQTWEESPEIDPEHGRPLSFLEMNHETAQAIWERSIAGVADLGPLAQYMVAMHFVILRRRGESSHAGPGAGFVAEYSAKSDEWLREWQTLSPENTPERAARALSHLQLFDALSLWLCCHEQPQPTRFPTSDGPEISLEADGGVVHIHPWPFITDQRELQVSGRYVPARKYASASDLAATPMQPITLRWMLVPSTAPF